MTPKIILIAALDESMGIGKDNKLPWSYPEDLARFKQVTMGFPIIMGRKTFESIGRPLPGRANVVLSNNRDYHPEGVIVMNMAEVMASIRTTLNNKVFVIGGEQIYKEFMPHATDLMFTLVPRSHECDTFFPPVEVGAWDRIGWEQPEGSPLTFVHYIRNTPSPYPQAV